MTRLLPIGLIIAAVVTSGCAAHHKAPSTQPGAAAKLTPRDDAQYPVIVRLVGRHYTVTALSGPDGVVYDAESTDGRPIVASATLDELRLRHPEIYQQILPGVATQGDGSNTRRRDTADDASVDGPIPMGHASQPATGLGMRGEMLLMDANR